MRQTDPNPFDPCVAFRVRWPAGGRGIPGQDLAGPRIVHQRPPARQARRVRSVYHEGLALCSVNTLILRVDSNYQYASHPELGDPSGLSKADVVRLVAACRQGKIRVIPQINLLGHQSWASHTNRLLEKYPDFDETPWVKMPDNYAWPNADHLYCKSYCPLHPKVHEVVFAVMDELCDAFESDTFHAGMDEVFYIGEQVPALRRQGQGGTLRRRSHRHARSLAGQGPAPVDLGRSFAGRRRQRAGRMGGQHQRHRWRHRFDPQGCSSATGITPEPFRRPPTSP